MKSLPTSQSHIRNRRTRQSCGNAAVSRLRSFAPSPSYRCGTVCAAAATAAPSPIRLPVDAQAHAAAVLRWACRGWPPSSEALRPTSNALGPLAASQPGEDDEGDAPQLRVTVRDLGPGRGRGLVALQDLAPGETLLSVPLTRVFTSDPSSELHWAAEMALRLLQARHELPAGNAQLLQQQRQQEQSRAGHAGDQEGQDGADDAEEEEGDRDGLGPEGWGPWIAALPVAVRTPLEYEEELVQQLGCPYVMEEVRQMQQCVRDCYEVLEPELQALQCGWPDFLWAVQVFHSRCFFEPGSGRHMCVPGVDMANHSAAPNAAVRIVHSPGACQGYDAVAEIAEPPPPEPSRFALVAGDTAIRCGEEVTISYGRWPAEAFLLLFGFVPSAPQVPATPPPPSPHAPTQAPPPAHDAAIADFARSTSGHHAYTADGATGSGSTGGSLETGCSSSDGVGEGGVAVMPGDCVVLFRDGEEAVRWALCCSHGEAPGEYEQQAQQGGLGRDAQVQLEGRVSEVLEHACALLQGQDLMNLVATPEGVDGRLQVILDLVSTQSSESVGSTALLYRRVQERLACFNPASTEEQVDAAVKSFLASKRALCLQLLTQLH